MLHEMTPRAYRHEEIAAVPRGFRVRTLVRGKHRVRVAFPAGRRRKGVGKLISILHPREENPCRMNPAELVIVGANPTGAGRWHGYIVLETGIKYTAAVSTRKAAFLAAEKAIDEHPEWKPVKSYGATKLENSFNPSAEGLFEEFHGAAPTGVATYQEPHVGGTLTELGDMVELTLLRPRGYKWGEIDFAGCGVKLASNAKGTQLYLIGGDQSLSRGTLTDLGADNSKDLVDLGEALKITYRAKKSITGGRAATWEHDFGEETGRRPQVSYDKNAKRILFSGGEYTIEAPGIIN